MAGNDKRSRALTLTLFSRVACIATLTSGLAYGLLVQVFGVPEDMALYCMILTGVVGAFSPGTIFPQMPQNLSVAFAAPAIFPMVARVVTSGISGAGVIVCAVVASIVVSALSIKLHSIPNRRSLPSPAFFLTFFQMLFLGTLYWWVDFNDLTPIPSVILGVSALALIANAIKPPLTMPSSFPDSTFTPLGDW